MDKREHLAAILWRTEAEGTGTPQSVIDLRTPEAFGNESQQTRNKWFKYADVAIAALEPVKVKPLEWEYHPAGGIAAPPTGHAYIIDTRTKGRVYSIKGFNPQRQFASMDEAKAAAQADYERRILAALAEQDGK